MQFPGTRIIILDTLYPGDKTPQGAHQATFVNSVVKRRARILTLKPRGLKGAAVPIGPLEILKAKSLEPNVGFTLNQAVNLSFFRCVEV